MGIRQHKTNPPERGKNEVSHIMSPTHCMEFPDYSIGRGNPNGGPWAP